MMTAVQLPVHGNLDSVLCIDRQLAGGASTSLLNEHVIESLWESALRLECDGPWYWLLLARLAEAALLCAGQYADSCEYRAAGDFLVNPREIRVIDRRSGSFTIKSRHGRMSDLFGIAGEDCPAKLRELAGRMVLETTRPPLLPHMASTLKDSGFISPDYVRHLEQGQCRIADTLAFLAAWHIEDAADLYRRLLASSASDKEFAESNLCRFDSETFNRLGADLCRSLATPGYLSRFLARRHPGPARRRPAMGSAEICSAPMPSP
jgi:hypothetical protein